MLKIKKKKILIKHYPTEFLFKNLKLTANNVFFSVFRLKYFKFQAYFFLKKDLNNLFKL